MSNPKNKNGDKTHHWCVKHQKEAKLDTRCCCCKPEDCEYNWMVSTYYAEPETKKKGWWKEYRIEVLKFIIYAISGGLFWWLLIL